jgi:hypothetical protein
MSGLMTRLNDLRARRQLTWSAHDDGWIGRPAAILDALIGDGYEERKRETTTSHRDRRPAGGLWQGVNERTGSVAAAIWVTRAATGEALMFIQIDGEQVARPGREPHEEEGGEA